MTYLTFYYLIFEIFIYLFLQVLLVKIMILDSEYVCLFQGRISRVGWGSKEGRSYSIGGLVGIGERNDHRGRPTKPQASSKTDKGQTEKKKKRYCMFD